MLRELLSATYTSTAAGETLVRSLTKAAGFSTENTISRLAVARSLLADDDDWTAELEMDQRGKQMRGSTLLGRPDVAAVLIAMMLVKQGRSHTPSSLRQLVRRHWDRGLRLIAADLKDREVSELLREYSERAVLAEIATERVAFSPDSVIGTQLVGQLDLKRRLISVLRRAVASDPPRLSTPLLLVGPEGSGRARVSLAIASALQLPFVEVVVRPDGDAEAVAFIQEQLAVQGYAVEMRGSRRWLPSAVIHLSASDRGSDHLVTVAGKLLSKRPEAGHMSMRGGVVTIGLLEPIASRGVRLEMQPYTRDEVAEILRRELGSLPLEMRRFLALAGRLRPGDSARRAKEFLTYTRQAHPGRRPSESMLLELMSTEWGVDRLGLGPHDYELLQTLARKPRAAADLDASQAEFLRALGFLQRRDKNWAIAPRGGEALRARPQEAVDGPGD